MYEIYFDYGGKIIKKDGFIIKKHTKYYIKYIFFNN
jgi:hypothetical protein